MRIRTPLAAFAALAILLYPNATANAHDSSLDEDLLEERLEAYAAVGDYAALAAVADGEDSWTGAAGNRSVDGDEEAESDDLFRIASLTKSMVATVVLQLEAEGELDLDDPIDDHLPGVLPYEEEITVRQLLANTSGLGEYFWKLFPSLSEGSVADLEARQGDHHTPQELIALATEEPLLFPPGEGWSYSTTGYLVLGLLIEDLTGDSLAHQLKERVFEPAGMDDAYFPRPNTSGFRGEHTTPYITTGDPSRPYLDTTDFSHSIFWSGGAVVADVDDVNAFYRAAADGTLLTAEQFAEAVEFRETNWGFEYGLGFVGLKPGCPDDPEEMFMGHTGGGVGHTTYSFHSLDGQRQVTLTWNLDNSHAHVDPDELQRTQDAFIAAALCGAEN